MGKLRRKPHEFKITVSSVWYDKTSRGAKEYEIHLTAARTGKVGTVRRRLREIAIPYFQRLVYRRVRKWIPRHKIKARFEREEPTQRSKSKIAVEGRSMLFRGKRWWAYPIGKLELNYAKRRRRKHGEGKRTKNRQRLHRRT